MQYSSLHILDLVRGHLVNLFKRLSISMSRARDLSQPVNLARAMVSAERNTMIERDAWNVNRGRLAGNARNPFLSYRTHCAQS